MDIGLSVQQAAGQVNVSLTAGHMKKSPSMYATNSCDETRLSVHRSKNHVRLSVFSLLLELLKLLLVHLSDPSNRPNASLLVTAAFQPQNPLLGSLLSPRCESALAALMTDTKSQFNPAEVAPYNFRVDSAVGI